VYTPDAPKPEDVAVLIEGDDDQDVDMDTLRAKGGSGGGGGSGDAVGCCLLLLSGIVAYTSTPCIRSIVS
jgi:hypothetical protein